MVTSAFKSTSRRATATEPKGPPPATAPRRRSQSVSAASRKAHAPFDDNNFTSPDFSNSRENPLFWSTPSSPPEEEQRGKITGVAASKNTRSHSLNNRNTRISNESGNPDSLTEHRGRSITRSFSENNGIGRSLSRVRGRSASRAPCRGSNESEKERDMFTSTVAQGRNEIKKTGSVISRTNTVRDRVDTRSTLKNVGVCKNRNPAVEWSEDDSACSLVIPNLEDGISTGSLSEAEEKTISAVCEDLHLMGEKWRGEMPPGEIYETVRSEVRRAISDIQNDLETAFRRNNGNSIATTNIADMPSDLVNPGAVELVSDIRKEYVTKLEESEERARKLRADLAVEEQRRQELDRILKEILPDPMSCGVQRSRRGRRTSNERKRMSKRLNEEAMAYFDECVSLSTFDSSDFSAPEDPPHSSFGANFLPGASSLAKESLHQKQFHNGDDSVLTVNSSNAEPETAQFYKFSFAEEKSENAGVQDDIMSYIKSFERGSEKDVELEEGTRSYYDAGEYTLQSCIETMLIDRVTHNSRIESGGLLICGGAASFLQFSPVM